MNWVGYAQVLLRAEESARFGDGLEMLPAHPPELGSFANRDVPNGVTLRSKGDHEGALRASLQPVAFLDRA